MIEENTYKIVLIILAGGFVGSTWIAIRAVNMLAKTNECIRVRHNVKLVDAAISLLQKTFDKAIDGSDHIVTSNMESFQRHMGAVEQNMLNFMNEGVQSDVLISIEEEFKSILRAFLNAYMNLPALEKESAKSSYEAVQENLEKLIGVLRAFQDFHKRTVTSNLIPLNTHSLLEFNVAHKEGLEAIDEFYENQN
ncbi:MAG: hypothetical protein ACKUBY_00300 [Candidatus Moraniibacteriota bacterium]|jgi:hypothetical protein